MTDQGSPAGAGTKVVAVTVIVALAASLVVGGAVYLWQSGQVDDEQAALAAAEEDAAQQLALIEELERDVEDLQAQLDKRKSQLEHQKGAHQKAEDQLASETSTDLEDGRYMTNIEAVDAASDPQTLTVDVLQWFTGDEANKAAKQDGYETPVPNDYYVRNESKALRTLPVAPGTDGEVLYWHRDMIQDGKTVPLEVFANVMSGGAGWKDINRNGLYWITLDNGEVTRIEVQFVP